MSAKLWEVSTSNAFSTTLNGSISAGDSTITLTTTTGLVFPGIITIDRVNGNGDATPNTREYVSFTGISSNQLTGCTRGLAGSTAQSHSSGAIVEETLTVTHWGELLDFLQVSHDASGNIIISSAATMAILRVLTHLNTSGASLTASEIRVTSHLNASGASITGRFPIHPTWVMSGAFSSATAGVGKPLIMPQDGLLQYFAATLRVQASTATLSIDINKNGTTVFSDQNTRLFIPVNGTFISTASIGDRSFVAGDIFTVDVDSGGGMAQDLTVLGRAL